MRRSIACVLMLGLVAGALLQGCSPRRTLAPKLAPETTLFVQGPVDTVSYRVHLYWFGTDPDGEVVRYEIRFKSPDAPADTAWVPTTRTDSLFAVYTPTGVSKPAFEVRAIDNDGMADPTPARQNFTFNNQPPTLFIASAPGPLDTTFASVTVRWVADDPDGDIRNATFRVWLDGHESDPIITTATTFTMPTDQFLQGGAVRAGRRMLSVQVIDVAGYASAPLSVQWNVRASVAGNRARLLIIDDVPGNTGPQLRQDSLFVNTAYRNLPDTSFSILRLEQMQPFRSASDLEQTLKLFEAVIWYRGTESSLQPILTDYSDGLARYLESGGRFFIESQRLVTGEGSIGIFPESWVSQYLGSDRLHKHETGVLADSSVSWGIPAADDFGNPVILRSTVFADSLRMTLGGYRDLRGFAVRDTHHVAIWARSGSLSEGNLYDIPVAVTVPQPGGGRLIAVTVPIRSTNGFGSVPRFLARVFEQFGLTGP